MNEMMAMVHAIDAADWNADRTADETADRTASKISHKTSGTTAHLISGGTTDHDASDDSGQATGRLILATVVDVVGSSYRRPTARMLILPDGSHIGTISGGCLERDLCRSASQLTKNGPRLVSFDTRLHSTNFNPRYHLGCSGIIYVLVEPITSKNHASIDRLRRVIQSEQALITATVYQADTAGWFSLALRFDDVDSLPIAFQTAVETIWADVQSTGRPTCCELAWESYAARILIERISPPKPLWIFGAGDDAIPLANMAWQLGWAVTVVDHRASRLSADRFPNARRVCDSWDKVLDQIRSTCDTVAVLMTHCFDADQVLIPALLRSAVSYVGLLGPKSRTGKIMTLLHQNQTLPELSSLERLHTPVGLDIGAVTPAEIAVSVLGEIVAVGNHRSGGRLGQRQDPIHEPVRHVLLSTRLPSHQAAMFLDESTS